MSNHGFKIENDVPLPYSGVREYRKSPKRYSVFDEMEVGQSILKKGTPEELKRFRAVIRTRNMRMKGQAKFIWDYENDFCDSIRVWRVE